MTSLSASHLLGIWRLLAHDDPRLWDAPHVGHGPLPDPWRQGPSPEPWRAAVVGPAVHVGGSLERAALNLQPLPPKALLALAVARSAAVIADVAIAVQHSGVDAMSMISDAGDDLCPNPPSPPRWPRRFPHPWPPGEPYPIDPEIARQVVQAQAAMVFQSYADRIADEELSAAFGGLADRLINAALQPAAQFEQARRLATVDGAREASPTG
jgi:hypothetical protein